MRRRDLVLTALAGALSGMPAALSAQTPALRRMALALGNDAYPNSPLRTPRDDVAAIGRRLAELGFRVSEARNLKLKDTQLAIYNFSQALQPGDVVLVYFAGHGMQYRGRNYLAPIGAETQDEKDIRNQMIGLDTLIEQLAPDQRAGVVVMLDACRINPFSRYLRVPGIGLAAVKPPPGTAVIMASTPGRYAFDGTEANSPFTAALLDALGGRGQSLEAMIEKTRARVAELTNGAQDVWSVSALAGPLVLVPATS